MSEGKAFNRKKIIDALQALGAELTREGVREKCGIDIAEEAFDLMQRLYPRREPPSKAKLFLQEILGG